MFNIEEFYIIGSRTKPIETECGQCNFLRVEDYPEYYEHLNALAVTKESIIYRYYCDDTHDNTDIIKTLKELSLFQMIGMSCDTLKLYRELYGHLFNNENILDIITEQQFMEYRQMIIKMNVVKENKINPNPEIQRWIDKDNEYKSIDAPVVTFADVVSTVTIGGGYTYKETNDMTLYQLYTSFHRVAKFKAYDTTTLFATVSTQTIDIENWCGHINLFLEEKHGLTQQEYNKKKQAIGLK